MLFRWCKLVLFYLFIFKKSAPRQLSVMKYFQLNDIFCFLSTDRWYTVKKIFEYIVKITYNISFFVNNVIACNSMYNEAVLLQIMILLHETQSMSKKI